jgi:diaminohydroxyphosphoribosylaminopyrimidine deaminase/5-amino-6-(5-phosphoribosylamino)uracil reductase
VTWKLATTLDGRSAAVDGSSRWVTGLAARADVHRLRAESDVVLVGTGTVLADDPRLTVRDTNGVDLPRQPLRAVMGLRELPAGRRVDEGCPAERLRTRDPASALDRLWRMGRRHVWLEGGPRLAAAFWRAGLIDRVVAYVAPALLGAGASAIADLGITTIADAARLTLDDVTRVGDDVRLVLRPAPKGKGN